MKNNMRELTLSWTLETYCGQVEETNSCNSELVIEPNDMTIVDMKHIDNHMHIDFGYTCPVCGKVNVIKEELVPADVQLYILNSVKQTLATKKTR